MHAEGFSTLDNAVLCQCVRDHASVHLVANQIQCMGQWCCFTLFSQLVASTITMLLAVDAAVVV